MIAPLATYGVLRTPTLPPFRGPLLEFWLHGGGLALRAARPGLEAVVPLGPPLVIPGLPVLAPFVHVGDPAAPDPRVPLALLGALLRFALAHGARECLAYLTWTAGPPAAWQLIFPPQQATRTSVRPTATGPDSAYARALIEIHSHHQMPPFWSAADNADEAGGLRLYGVLGYLPCRPRLRLRIGLYGHFWEVPLATVFALPAPAGAPQGAAHAA